MMPSELVSVVYRPKMHSGRPKYGFRVCDAPGVASANGGSIESARLWIAFVGLFIARDSLIERYNRLRLDLERKYARDVKRKHGKTHLSR